MQQPFDPEAQDFFKKRWHHRLSRIKKRLLPILVSSGLVFSLIMAFNQLIQTQFTTKGDCWMMITHTLLTVGLGILVVLLGDSLYLRRISRFSPILIKIRRRRKYD
jgi:hypothetical protein